MRSRLLIQSAPTAYILPATTSHALLVVSQSFGISVSNITCTDYELHEAITLSARTNLYVNALIYDVPNTSETAKFSTLSKDTCTVNSSMV